MTVSANPPALFGYRKFWASRFGTAPFLPMSRAEMDELGWDSCDIIIVTGDAYVDHPSFGMAVIGRVLEAQGFRVGIIAQPDWNSTADFLRFGLRLVHAAGAAGHDLQHLRPAHPGAHQVQLSMPLSTSFRQRTRYPRAHCVRIASLSFVALRGTRRVRCRSETNAVRPR